jgi:hypothetical protein
MRVLGLAFAVLLALTLAGYANGPGPNMGPANSRPAPGIVLVWDGGSSGGHSGAIGGQPTAGHLRQWNGQWAPPHWGPSRYYGGPGVPTYWVYVPGSAVFDYPFPDWRGPMGGWGNP